MAGTCVAGVLIFVSMGFVSIDILVSVLVWVLSRFRVFCSLESEALMIGAGFELLYCIDSALLSIIFLQ